MRIPVIFLSLNFVLLQAGSDTIPIWLTAVTPTVDTSPPLSMSPKTAQQLADEGEKNQKIPKYSITPLSKQRKEKGSPGRLNIIMKQLANSSIHHSWIKPGPTLRPKSRPPFQCWRVFPYLFYRELYAYLRRPLGRHLKIWLICTVAFGKRVWAN